MEARSAFVALGSAGVADDLMSFGTGARAPVQSGYLGIRKGCLSTDFCAMRLGKVLSLDPQNSGIQILLVSKAFGRRTIPSLRGTVDRTIRLQAVGTSTMTL